MIRYSYISDGNVVERTINTPQELFSLNNYNQIIFINISHTRRLIFEKDLPPNLQVLTCNDCNIFTLPRLPSTLTNLYAKHNRISKFPEIEHCNALEILDLEDNDIEEVDAIIPTSLMTLMLSFNKIRVFNFSQFNVSTSIALSYNFLYNAPPRAYNNVTYDHNNIGENIRGNNVIPIDRIGFDKAKAEPFKVFNDSQNVHNTHIQKTVNESLKYIVEYKPKWGAPSDRELLKMISKEYYLWKNGHKYEDAAPPERDIVPIKKSKILEQIKKYICNLFNIQEYNYTSLTRNYTSLTSNSNYHGQLELWWNEQSVHSTFGITYRQLLKQVWGIIEDNDFKEEMKKCLFQEISASMGVCFTGRFNRTINALSGFIDEVHVGISEGEEMQNRIVMCLRKLRELHGDQTEEYIEAAKKEVDGILTEFNIAEADKSAWLDAI